MTFYFFDVETTGFSARDDRIMQFAGQRTDMDLKPLGDPDNILIKLTPDILPQPDAVLVHGISPQQTVAEGITEAEFCRYLTSQVSTKDTILVGYNNIRFDNDFIRFTLWRNFHDAYEWSYKEGCSTWDLLDVVRMTRALRPDGIKWPFNADGTPSNKLEFLSSANKLDHVDAHDALSDVKASIALARLLKTKQPKLFNYLLDSRKKDKVIPFVTSGKPFVYTSGRYQAEYNKTAVAACVTQTADKSGALVYDLRIDPDEFARMTPAQLARLWANRPADAAYFPVKLLKYNRCPAIAPTAVLEVDDGYTKLQLHKEIINNHLSKLQKLDGFGDKLLKAMDIMWPRAQAGLVADPQKVDNQLYDGFVPNEDKTKMSALRAAKPEDIVEFNFKDGRLKLLQPLYKARNYHKTLNDDEQVEWENFRRQKLVASGRAENFFKKLEELSKTPGLDGQKTYLLEELSLYAQSIIPAPTVDR